MDSYIKNIIETAVTKAQKPKKKKKQDVEEVVDYDGSILGSKIPVDYDVKTITAKKTTDDSISMSHQPSTTGAKMGTSSDTTRYWGESDMSATLGYEETMGKDKSYDEAKHYFMQQLGFDEPEAEERLKALGYVKKADDKVRLIEDIIDDVIQNQGKKEINPIIQRQLLSLRNTMEAHNLTIEDIIPYLNGK
jgi:hypothetical protein